MGKIESAVEWAVGIAGNNTHGYDQSKRWGPDYDCSSLVITAYQTAGVPVKTNGATYTGNMKTAFLKSGFFDVTGKVNLINGYGLQRGDVLLNIVHHTAMYIGNGQIVQASINEKGHAVGGVTGDQTGREIWTRSYYNFPWNCVLRYQETQKMEKISIPVTVDEVVYGSKGKSVILLQTMLNGIGYSCGTVDGDAGDKTVHSMKSFQADKGLSVDGDFGKASWTKLFSLYE